MAKKSLSAANGRGPSWSAHSSASHARSPSRGAEPSSLVVGSGHGRALRSTLPEVFMGSSSMRHSAGTIPPGSRSTSQRRASERSTDPSSSGTR